MNRAKSNLGNFYPSKRRLARKPPKYIHVFNKVLLLCDSETGQSKIQMVPASTLEPKEENNLKAKQEEANMEVDA